MDQTTTGQFKTEYPHRKWALIVVFVCVAAIIIVIVFVVVFRQICINSPAAVSAMRSELMNYLPTGSAYTTGTAARIPSDSRMAELVDSIRNFAGSQSSADATPGTQQLTATTCDNLETRARQYVQACMPSWNIANCSITGNATANTNAPPLCRTFGNTAIMSAGVYGTPCYPIQAVPIQFPGWDLPANPADDNAPLVTQQSITTSTQPPQTPP